MLASPILEDGGRVSLLVLFDHAPKFREALHQLRARLRRLRVQQGQGARGTALHKDGLIAGSFSPGGRDGVCQTLESRVDAQQ